MLQTAWFCAFSSELKKEATSLHLAKVRGLVVARKYTPRLRQTPLQKPFSGNWTKRAVSPAPLLLGAGALAGGGALAHKALTEGPLEKKELPSAHLARNAKTWWQTPGAPLHGVLR